jgi:hypothetical protein
MMPRLAWLWLNSSTLLIRLLPAVGWGGILRGMQGELLGSSADWSLWVKGLYGNPYLWVETELATGADEFADPDAITLQHLTPAAKKRKGSSK